MPAVQEIGRRYAVARACQDRNFRVSLNRLILSRICSKIQELSATNRAILVVASSEGAAQGALHNYATPVYRRFGRSWRSCRLRAGSARGRFIGKASMNANVTSAAVFAWCSASGFPGAPGRD